MLFLIQKELNKTDYSFETSLLKDIIEQSLEYKTGLYEYKETDISNIFNYGNKDCIPVGDLEFVQAWLKLFYDKSLVPIEVPEILRTPEFLKRDYKICTPDNFPNDGCYFVKNADRLKSWSFCGDIKNIKSQLDRETNYVVSETVDILSEWRVYVISGQIENIVNYDGDSTIFPDSNLIRKAVAIYSSKSNSPKSYTIDVMVTPKGTAIIEIHSFVSVGLYSSLWGLNLARAYKDGIDYYINC